MIHLQILVVTKRNITTGRPTMKKISTLLSTLICLLLLGSAAYAAEGGSYIQEAEKLQELGLFKGSNQGFELERAPSRVEAAVMLVRLLGKEEQVLASQSQHPFTDVPAWADPYVGYMYEAGLTKGVSATQFGATQLTSASQFATFVLRALGYSDQNGDFTWNTALEKAVETGLLESEMAARMGEASFVFLRDDMAFVAYEALSVPVKDVAGSLADKLAGEGVFDKYTANQLGVRVSDLVEADGATVMPLTYSDYYEPWQTHKVIIDRNLLPESMREFTYITCGGIWKPEGSYFNYLIRKRAYYGDHTDYAEPYNDATGTNLTNYDYMSFQFRDKAGKLLGFAEAEGLKEGESTMRVYPFADVADLPMPQGYQELYDRYATLEGIESGIRVYRSENIALLKIDQSELPQRLKGARYAMLKLCSGGERETSIDHYVASREIYMELDDLPTFKEGILTTSSSVSAEKNEILHVVLFDENKEVIGFHELKDSDYVMDSLYFVKFEGNILPGDASFERSDFIIRKFIDGVETFGFREDFGWGSYTEEDGSGTFGIGPIVRENDSVTYTIEMLNPRMQLE